MSLLQYKTRADVPTNGGNVLVANFGPVAYHDPEPRYLEDYLRFAKPLGVKGGERLDGGKGTRPEDR